MVIIKNRIQFIQFQPWNYFPILYYKLKVGPYMADNCFSLSSVTFEAKPRQTPTHCCRICLQIMKTEQLCFCNCKDERQFVHQPCLFQWIMHHQINEEFGETFSTCEICNGRIMLRTESKCRLRSCRSWSYHLVYSQNDKCQWKYLAFLFVYFVLIAFFTLMVVKYINLMGRTYLITAIVMGILLLVCTIGFCIQSAIVFKSEVVSIESRDLLHKFGKDFTPYQ